MKDEVKAKNATRSDSIRTLADQVRANADNIKAVYAQAKTQAEGLKGKARSDIMKNAKTQRSQRKEEK